MPMGSVEASKETFQAGIMSMRMILRILLLLLFAYVGYALVMLLFQRNMVYPGRSLAPATLPSGIASGAEELWIITSFGKVEGRFVSESNAGRRPAVIYFHGNGELIDMLSPELDMFRQLGCSVLLVEYPGYGRSSGRPHQRSLAETALAAYDMLVQRGDVDASRIVSFGSSLGAGPAVALATNRPVAALLLAAPLASLRPFARERFLPSFLLHDAFDNALLVKKYSGPLLVIHGRRDSFIPYTHGKQVADATPRGRLVLVDADHNDILSNRDFWLNVKDFMLDAGIIDSFHGDGR